MKTFFFNHAPLFGILAISGVSVWLVIDAIRAAAAISAAFSA